MLVLVLSSSFSSLKSCLYFPSILFSIFSFYVIPFALFPLCLVLNKFVLIFLLFLALHLLVSYSSISSLFRFRSPSFSSRRSLSPPHSSFVRFYLVLILHVLSISSSRLFFWFSSFHLDFPRSNPACTSLRNYSHHLLLFYTFFANPRSTPIILRSDILPLLSSSSFASLFLHTVAISILFSWFSSCPFPLLAPVLLIHLFKILLDYLSSYCSLLLYFLVCILTRALLPLLLFLVIYLFVLLFLHFFVFFVFGPALLILIFIHPILIISYPFSSLSSCLLFLS